MNNAAESKKYVQLLKTLVFLSVPTMRVSDDRNHVYKRAGTV